MRRNRRRFVVTAALTTAAFVLQTATALAGNAWY